MKNQKGFALLDVLLAVVLIITISIASYEMINTYHDKANVQTAESDLINIAQNYAPLLNQSAITNTGSSIFGSSGSYIAVSFLKSVPIPESRITTIVTQNGVDYANVATNLMTDGKQSRIGFEETSLTDDSSSHYFLMGMQVNYSQAVQLIQDLNDTFSIFVGDSNDYLQDAKPASTLPQCKNKDCILNIYFVTPTLDDVTKIANKVFLVPPLKAPE